MGMMCWDIFINQHKLLIGEVLMTSLTLLSLRIAVPYYALVLN
jgi:hypothetical protein